MVQKTLEIDDNTKSGEMQMLWGFLAVIGIMSLHKSYGSNIDKGLHIGVLTGVVTQL